jgi:hypothetical protein
VERRGAQEGTKIGINMVGIFTSICLFSFTLNMDDKMNVDPLRM